MLFDNEVPVAIRTQDWKYVDAIYYRGNRLPMALFPYQELYDHRADRTENYSVAVGNPEVAKAMKGRLDTAKATFAPLKHKDIPQAFKTLKAQFEHIQD